MTDEEFVKTAKALADPTRRRMIERIREAGQLTCSQVCELFPLRQPTISHHVKTLEAAGLIEVAREGQFHILRLNEDSLREFARVVAGPKARAKAS
ncbi:MAG: helix-turn-helix transcriptional regulator [Planctomycetes bacterium]|nr:helix-turn-helix transcriptional regulator [Planctomycetota bacterium]